jgi:hypothetical protein
MSDQSLFAVVSHQARPYHITYYIERDEVEAAQLKAAQLAKEHQLGYITFHTGINLVTEDEVARAEFDPRDPVYGGRLQIVDLLKLDPYAAQTTIEKSCRVEHLRRWAAAEVRRDVAAQINRRIDEIKRRRKAKREDPDA